MDEEDKSVTRRALLAGSVTLAFGGGVAYLATDSGGSEDDYRPASFYTSDKTTDFGNGVDLTGRPIVGERDAPLDIYYWTDYLCPFCKEFETKTLPEVGRNYLDTGDARLVMLGYPNIGEYSEPAAVWGRCVWAQVAESDPMAFWNWNGAAFDAQVAGGNDWADEETFREITEQTSGVNLNSVEECRASRGEAIRRNLDADVDVALSAGIQGTPGFVIYNRESGAAGKLVGAHPYENFADALDQVREA